MCIIINFRENATFSTVQQNSKGLNVSQTSLQIYSEQHLMASGDNINRLSVLSCDVDQLLSRDLQLIWTPVICCN